MTDMSNEALWDGYLAAGRSNGEQGDIELFDIEGMNDAAYAMKERMDDLAAKLVEVKAERDAAMRVADENWVTHQEIIAARAALVTARNEALDEAAKVAVDYGKVQYSANIERHPQYASDAADDALEIANAIRALPTPTAAELMARIAQTTEGEYI